MISHLDIRNTGININSIAAVLKSISPLLHELLQRRRALKVYRIKISRPCRSPYPGNGTWHGFLKATSPRDVCASCAF